MLMPSLLRPLAIGPKVGNDFSLYRPCEFGRSFFYCCGCGPGGFLFGGGSCLLFGGACFPGGSLDAVAAFLAVVGVVELLTTEPGITSL